MQPLGHVHSQGMDAKTADACPLYTDTEAVPKLVVCVFLGDLGPCSMLIGQKHLIVHYRAFVMLLMNK